jgi:hypothetical protein
MQVTEVKAVCALDPWTLIQCIGPNVIQLPKEPRYAKLFVNDIAINFANVNKVKIGSFANNRNCLYHLKWNDLG